MDRTGAVALVAPESYTRLFSEPYFAAIIEGAVEELSATDLQVALVVVRTERERTRLARHLEERPVDGALLLSVQAHDPLPSVFERLGIPAVLGGRRSNGETLSCVYAENIGGAHNAVDLLLSRGCHIVATITGDLDQQGAQARLEGYRRALEEAGFAADEELVEAGDFSEESGAAAMTALLRRRPDVEGVFAASDVMAAGALRVLREAGRAVPDDVALVGWDDSDVARGADPPLTSIRQPTEELGRAMARLLLDEMAEPDRARREVVLGTELVRRASA
ncbi:LacI family DNA-binding transcriptional regulator [Streptomyces sp. NRRL F-5123]|uniref:LacI family DNA-binding transcriptional regulator n=1 Tax=Streptomyces sp. NRRL F-5123 TaxID=1463856 RepID=UPI0006950462|nr:substrate-binding domain-containing protein [Streptomyces sp. NRRL F-5123]